jgi:Ca2+-binding EF-hand superfamily protein
VCHGATTSNVNTGDDTIAKTSDDNGMHNQTQQHVSSEVTPDEALLLSPEQEEHILQVYQLFDTDDSGFLDESELHSAMFALGYISDYNDNISAMKDFIGLRQSDSIGNGVTKDEFRNIMRGSLLGRGAMEEIRMTFDAIVCMAPNLANNLQSSQQDRRQGRDSESTISDFQSGDQTATDGALPEVSQQDPGERFCNTSLVGSITNSNSQPPSNAVSPSNFQKHRLVRNRKVRGGCDGARITFENLRLACQRFDVKLTDEELKNIIRETDRDHSGDVDWDEYVNILKNSCWF